MELGCRASNTLGHALHAVSSHIECIALALSLQQLQSNAAHAEMHATPKQAHCVNLPSERCKQP